MPMVKANDICFAESDLKCKVVMLSSSAKLSRAGLSNYGSLYQI